MPLPTPFHECAAPHCESGEWNDWSGYLAATVYEPNHDREYYAIRNGAAAVDISPLYKYDVHGPQAWCLLDRLVTRDVAACQPRQVMYTPWCDEAGKIMDDGTLARLAEDRFRVTAAHPSLRWFQDVGYGLEAEVEDVSEGLAALAVQGPNSRAVLKRVIEGADLDRLGYFRLTEGRLGPAAVTITRTGYTGDLGYELWVESDVAARLWTALFSTGRDHGLLPTGTAALDVARIEAGLLLVDVDYIPAPKALTENQKSTPFDLGLGWAVAFTNRDFVGRRALMEARARGREWALVGLRYDWEVLRQRFDRRGLPPLLGGRARRDPVPVYYRGRRVGQVTSRTFSPILKQYIGLGSLPANLATPGTRIQVEMTVEYVRERVPATVVPLPFYNPSHKRG